MMFADAHVHLSDCRWSEQMDELIPNWTQNGISYFMQGGVDPTEWQVQKKLKKKHPGQIGLCFGLHPWFVAESSVVECETALDQLACEISEADALGEIGLDFREAYVLGEARERQIDYFQMQLEISHAAQKPCVLHLVRAFEQGLRILQWTGLPERKGMIHAFNGSAESMQAYLDIGLYISIGAAVLWPKNKKLLKAVSALPLDRLLLESDAPDQPPPDEKGVNTPLVLFQVAQKIAHIKGIATDVVLNQAQLNFKKLFL